MGTGKVMISPVLCVAAKKDLDSADFLAILDVVHVLK
jgi:hypothetical protein